MNLEDLESTSAPLPWVPRLSEDEAKERNKERKVFFFILFIFFLGGVMRCGFVLFVSFVIISFFCFYWKNIRTTRQINDGFETVDCDFTMVLMRFACQISLLYLLVAVQQGCLTFMLSWFRDVILMCV